MDRGLDLTERIAQTLRGLVVDGELTAGAQVNEVALSERLRVSRNTLREAVRILVHEGILERRPHRGVFVAAPDLGDVLDLYRVRRIIEIQAVRDTPRHHPGIARVIDVAERAAELREDGDWSGVGSTNMDFHAAIVALVDSPMLDAMFRTLLARMRLAFSQLGSPEFVHGPFVDDNLELAKLIRDGDTERAAELLDTYFMRSERTVTAAYGRMDIERSRPV
ncbi:GntR family transcriptional regulator [Millisia brevis]|uniref:GntR family transcriptional regulator n=1 Tax=Millisia brevis TaxID=264148 RepID=UPI00082B4536|nr:GntR family transcriptional regulator [Millisia brevis]